jgi:hypothetical protein
MMIDVCLRLRPPLILPRIAWHHDCEWEPIDIYVLGCLVCCSIHACNVCTCAEVIETNDSVVCVISGAVLRNQMYSQVNASVVHAL